MRTQSGTSSLKSSQLDYDWSITSHLLQQVNLQTGDDENYKLLSLLSDPSNFPANVYGPQLITEVRYHVHVLVTYSILFKYFS